MRLTRRALLGTSGAAFAGLAGCPGPADDRGEATAGSPTETDGPAPTTASAGSARGCAGDGAENGIPNRPPRACWGVRAGPHPGAPTVAGDRIFVGAGKLEVPKALDTDGAVHAFDAAGERRWSRDLENGVDSNWIVVRDGIVHAISGFGALHGWNYTIHAFRVDDGSSRWTYAPKLGGSFFEPIGIDDERIYLGTHDDHFETRGAHVIAVDRRDGSESWRTDSGDVRGGTVGAGTVVANSAGYVVSGLDPATGQRRWKITPGLYFDTVLAGDVVVVVGDETVRAVGLADGDERWTYDLDRDDTTEPWSFDGIVLDGSVVVGGDRLVKLLPDGRVRWQTVTGGEVSGAVRDRSALYVPREGGVARIDHTRGRTIWRQEVPGEHAPGYLQVVGDSLALLTSSRGHYEELVVLDAETGNERWDWSPEPALGGLAAIGGTLLVTTEDGWLWAVDP